VGHPGFTSSELSSVTEFLQLSCTERTWGNYEPKWKKWVDYIENVDGMGKGDMYLTGVTPKNRVFRIILFIKHQYQLGDRKGKIEKILSAMKSKFQLAAANTDVFSEILVCRAKCSSIGTNEELKEMNRKKKLESPTLPMCEDMIVKARPMFWEGQTWDGPGMVSKAIWLCLGIGFNFGARISNAAAEKHYTRVRSGLSVRCEL
jgi:hypothetical protein